MSKELFGNPTKCIRQIDASKPLEWLRVLIVAAQIGLGAFCVWAFLVIMSAAGGTAQ